MKLLPEDNFELTDPEELLDEFIIRLDVDNYDYILSNELLMTMDGPHLYPKKKAAKRFTERYVSISEYKDINNLQTQQELIEVFKGWEIRQQMLSHTNNKVANEKAAFLRALKYTKQFKLELFCVYVENKMVGFTVFEQVSKEYAISSFQKAYREHPGIYEFMYKKQRRKEIVYIF